MPEIVLHKISRYPIKGLSEEVLESVELAPGRGLPFDRQFALALPDTPFDPENPAPLPKFKFAVLMKFANLARLVTAFDTTTGMFRAAHGNLSVTAPLNTVPGRSEVERFFSDFMKDELTGNLRIVAAPGHRFTDVSVVSPEMMEAVSLINLASVRALAEKTGTVIDPRRFRANFLVDGLPPWAEFDLIDKTVSIGDVSFKAVKRTKRCAATEVNPETAERDIRLPLELMKNFGHGDLGIYLTVQSAGVVRTSDRLLLR